MGDRTLYDKLWERHLVREYEDGNSLLYIDRHLVHEVTSPQAFSGLAHRGREPWRAAAVLAMPDHNVSTDAEERRQGLDGIRDALSREQLRALQDNCARYGMELFSLQDVRQGIVHVSGPEQGAVLPGMTVVCGDSHTSTHGALGTLAQGIGTSDIEHVLATQCLVQRKQRNMCVLVNGCLPDGCSAKDLILYIVGALGVSGGSGYALEYAGEAVRALSMEGRMTLCNMSIEAGARCGMVAVDERTVEYLRGRPMAPRGEGWERACADWLKLKSDADAQFDETLALDAGAIAPQISWGTTPAMVGDVESCVPHPEQAPPESRDGIRAALRYMDLEPGTALRDIRPDRVFIGSCTNSRIEDLRAAAAVVRGRRVASSVRQAMVVPGSGLVQRQAEEEGLHRVFLEAGLEWRAPGCSMCLAMNADRLEPGERCASTSNRNFEGRQGRGGRTHLMSPAMAAAAAVTGRFTDVRELEAAAA